MHTEYPLFDLIHNMLSYSLIIQWAVETLEGHYIFKNVGSGLYACADNYGVVSVELIHSLNPGELIPINILVFKFRGQVELFQLQVAR